MASRQSSKFKNVWIMMVYVLKCIFFRLFFDFELQRLAISRPINVEKRDIPKKKALLSIVWKKF